MSADYSDLYASEVVALLRLDSARRELSDLTCVPPHKFAQFPMEDLRAMEAQRQGTER